MMKRHNSMIIFGSNTKKSKKTRKNKDEEDDEEEVEDTTSNLFKQEDTGVYLKNNHLYYHVEISEKSVDRIKKLMRDYLTKIIKIKNTQLCMKIEPKPLVLHIYSPGGDVYAGLSLYDFISEYNNTIPVHTIIEGFSASAATIISMAGLKRYITPSSYMLIHQLSTFMGGNFEQIKDEFDNCQKLMIKIKSIYEKKTTIPKKQLADILKHDIIFDANECVKYGLVDEIKLIDIFNDVNQ